jgi:hypothetical protein
LQQLLPLLQAAGVPPPLGQARHGRARSASAPSPLRGPGLYNLRAGLRELQLQLEGYGRRVAALLLPLDCLPLGLERLSLAGLRLELPGELQPEAQGPWGGGAWAPAGARWRPAQGPPAHEEAEEAERMRRRWRRLFELPLSGSSVEGCSSEGVVEEEGEGEEEEEGEQEEEARSPVARGWGRAPQLPGPAALMPSQGAALGGPAVILLPGPSGTHGGGGGLSSSPVALRRLGPAPPGAPAAAALQRGRRRRSARASGPLPLASLRAFELQGCHVGAELLPVLVASGSLARLSSLRLALVSGLVDGALAALAPLTTLESLEVRGGARRGGWPAAAAAAVDAAGLPLLHPWPAGGRARSQTAQRRAARGALTAARPLRRPPPQVLAPVNRRVSQAPLAALAQLTGLRALSWQSDDLSNRGPAVAALCAFTGLRSLQLSCSPATLALACGGDMGLLRRHLPYCSVQLVGGGVPAPGGPPGQQA